MTRLSLGMYPAQVYRRSSRGIGSLLLMAFAMGLLAGSELALLYREVFGWP